MTICACKVSSTFCVQDILLVICLVSLVLCILLLLKSCYYLGYYIGHVQSVLLKVDGVEYKLDYEYLKPSKFFDLNKLENSGVSACICARIHNDTKVFGLVSIGILHFYLLFSQSSLKICKKLAQFKGLKCINALFFVRCDMGKICKHLFRHIENKINKTTAILI